MAWKTEIQFLAGAMTVLFLFATASRSALGHTQLPIQWVQLLFLKG
jgi:hypothetical protein